MRATRSLLSAVLFVSLAVAVCWALPAYAVDGPDREWLVLVYVSGINDRGLMGHAKDMINQLEKIGSGDRTTTLIKYAMMGTGNGKDLQFPEIARILRIKGDKGDPEISSPVVESSPLSDMASEMNLFMFVRKSILKYPARRVMLVLWGKGQGFRGALDDDLSRKRLSLPAMAKALSRARKDTKRALDVLVLDADLMQMAETIYELKDEADIIVGSEESHPGNHYLYAPSLQEAIEDPATNSINLAGAMVYFGEDAVCSAVQTEKVSGFVKALDRWTAAVTKDGATLKAASTAIDGTFRFAMRDSKDLVDFIDRVTEAVPGDSEAAKRGQELKKYILEELVVATHWSIERKTLNGKPYGTRSHGLAIYLPEVAYDSGTYESLAFASDSSWPRFLLTLLEERRKK